MGKMLITSAIFKCFDPILTAVASSGARIFKPARLPIEKDEQISFYRAFSPTSFSDHLLVHNMFSHWREDRGIFSLQYPYGHSRISYANLRKTEESRVQIYREFRNNFGNILSASMGDDLNVNAKCEGIVRLLLASGYYPDIAFLDHPLKRRFRLRTIKDARMASNSINSLLGKKNDDGRRGSKGFYRDNRQSRQEKNPVLPVVPRYFIYEELTDVGQKLISRTTAVDPIFFAIFAENLRLRPSTSQQAGFTSDAKNGSKELLVDDWLVIRSENEQDLRLLMEFGLHWNSFIQFSIQKSLSGVAMTMDQLVIVKEFMEVITEFAQHGDIYRKPELTSNQLNDGHNKTDEKSNAKYRPCDGTGSDEDDSVGSKADEKIACGKWSKLITPNRLPSLFTNPSRKPATATTSLSYEEYKALFD